MTSLKTMVAVATLALGGTALAQGAPAKKPEAAKPATTKPAAAKPEAAAKPPEGMGMPTKPPAEMEQMKGMIGTWRCDGKMSGGGMEMPIRGTSRIGWDLDGMWLVQHVTGAKAKGMPRAYKATVYYTYDPMTKEFVRLTVDNMGVWGKETSKGMEGDSRTWNGQMSMMGHTGNVKTTETKKGPKEVQIESTGPDGTMTLDCKK